MTFKNKSVAALFLAASITVFAQQEQDSLYKNIEVVKITKLTTKSQNKQNLETKQSDNLNHDAGKFLNSLPEINGIRKAGNYATDPVLRGFKYEQLNIVIDGAAAATTKDRTTTERRDSMRERPEPQLLLAGRPQACDAVRLLDQEEDDQAAKDNQLGMRHTRRGYFDADQSTERR